MHRNASSRWSDFAYRVTATASGVLLAFIAAYIMLVFISN